MATYNILSSCICRDAFGFRVDNKHEVIRFLQSSQPITWFHLNDKPQIKLGEDAFEDITTLTNFQKKCIINDYNKTVLEQYDIKADFFITDLVSFAGTGLAKEIYDDNSEHYFTNSKWFQIAYKGGVKNKLNGKIENVNRFHIITDDFISDFVRKYIEWIQKQGYSPEEIILVENKKVTSYSDGEMLYYFEKSALRNRINSILDKVYLEFEKQLSNCYVVKMPIGVYADVHHKWGLIDLHYCREYYDYLYECFDLISRKNNCQGEICLLRDSYSERLQENRDRFIQNSISHIRGEQLLGNLYLENNYYISNKKVPFYKDDKLQQLIGKTKGYFNALRQNHNTFRIISGESSYYISWEDCIRGVVGNDRRLNDFWKTVNSNTVVISKDFSILVGHNHSNSLAQTQIIQTVELTDGLEGKVVTLSVYARVLEKNNDDAGGTIAIINGKNYNSGKFYAKKDFINKDWQRIVLSVRLPQKDDFNGVTVCLRAVAGSGNEPKHALVEFCHPKLEIGSFATKI